TTIPTNAAIPLEYNLPNVVGSVAMARTSNPNSATDQWFVNLVDNSSTLGPGGSSTDGYAVFGKILGNGMDVLNKIASLDVHNEGSGVFSQLPLGQSNQLVRISSMTVDSIDGTVFTDTNGNDKLDAGEAGVAGRTVFIDNDGTGVPDANNPSTVTDANGNYTFSGLAAGTYHVREVSPDNVTVSEPLQTVTVAADATSAGVDFAEQVIPPTPQESYITAVYQDILGRAPDAEGLAYWEQQLTAGTKRSVFTSFLSHSDEYYSNFVIKPDYLKYLGREADDAGVAYWLGKIHGGLTDQRLETDLLASDEYFEHAGGDNAHWIDGIYQSLLNRGADPNGVKYWLAQLSNGEARAQIALSIASGPEAETLTISDDYMHFLGREPDADGKAYWLKQFASGKHNEDLIAAFAASDEYYQERTS
ncbi:MAG TPA: DUF4214 domain-containing protein, partial [Pirellulales bacterium]|nr:DUF4214 domain-containing protein [Pirellulales bacterium]